MTADRPRRRSDDRMVPSDVRPLRGDERFVGADVIVADFWRWAFSDLRANVTRGILAEFLVARAVGADEPVRDPWGNFDVKAPDGTRIEVKSSAYLQSWPQRAHSKISFSGLTGLAFDPETNEWDDERSVRADVFVFCVYVERDPASYDALDVGRWQFYVVSAERVRAAGVRAVSLAWVERQAEPVPFAALADAVKAARSTDA